MSENMKKTTVADAASADTKTEKTSEKKVVNKKNTGKNYSSMLMAAKEELWNHRKVALPIVLVLLVLLTLFIGMAAHEKEKEAPQPEVTGEEITDAETTVSEEEMAVNAVPAVNELINQYYNALAQGDVDTISKLVNPASETYLIKMEEFSKYIDSYDEITVYTKSGPLENSYLVFANTQVKMTEFDSVLVPGLVTFYVCPNADGSYYINLSEDVPREEAEYIQNVDMQSDVIDLNNKIAVQFNDLLAENAEFAEYYAAVDTQITSAVSKKIEEISASLKQEQNAEQEQQAENTVKTVKATDVVNMRSSDSEKADKIAKAQIGDTFTLLEERPNGWSKVEYQGKEVFIKSDYLEVVSETPANAAEGENAQASDGGNTSNAKTATASTTVNVRKSASETADKLGKLQGGEKIEVVTKQNDGWTKVNYKGKTGYVKTEFLTF